MDELVGFIGGAIVGVGLSAHEVEDAKVWMSDVDDLGRTVGENAMGENGIESNEVDESSDVGKIIEVICPLIVVL